MKNFTKRNWLIILLLITILGGYLRFYGLDWGLPCRYHCDENTFIDAANAMRKAPHLNYLNPKWFYHPSLSIYIVCFLSWLYSLIGPLTLPQVHLLGRLNSAFWGTVSIPMLYLLGRRLYGPVTGILAALFLSVTVIHLQMSHFFTPDVTLVFFLMATMYFSAGVMKSGTTRDYLCAGIAAGIGMASKYWAPSVAPLIIAYLIRLISNRTTGWKENKKLLLSLILAGISFFILSPYVILDAGTAIPKILWWAKKTTGEIPQIWAYHFEGTLPYLFHIKHNLPWALGWPLAIISGAGFILVLIRHRREDILLASWIIINILLIGSWYIKSIRYILPIIPFLCLCAAGLISYLVSEGKPKKTKSLRGVRNERRSNLFKFQRRLLRHSVPRNDISYNIRRFSFRYFLYSYHVLRIIGITLGLFALLWSATFSLAFINIYTVTHSKTQASEWIYDNIPPGSHIATDLSIPLGARNGLPDLFEEEHLDFPYLFESSLSYQEKEYYLREILEKSDYIVIADELREYFKAGPRDYPVERKLLRKLFSGNSEFVLLKSFKTYPRLGPWTWKDDGAELSFHFFDHPAIYVFKKNNQ